MGSTSGIGIPVQIELPKFTEASTVLAKIESQVGDIQNLFAQVQQLMSEIRALQAEKPDPANFMTTDENGKKVLNQPAFTAAMTAFQQKLADVNQRLEQTYRKLGQAQAVLQFLQNRELPAAEKKDAERLQEAAEQARTQLEATAKTASEMRKDTETGSKAEGMHIELRVIEKKVNFEATVEGASLKDTIRAFALLAQIVGDGASEARKSNPMIGMPHTPGSGLPPVGTL